TLSDIADVSDPCAINDMMASTVHRFGLLDVLVNNAGVHEGGRSGGNHGRAVKEGHGDRHRRRILWLACRHPTSRALVSWTGGDWSLCRYNAAKDAVVSLTRALAMDLEERW